MAVIWLRFVLHAPNLADNPLRRIHVPSVESIRSRWFNPRSEIFRLALI